MNASLRRVIVGLVLAWAGAACHAILGPGQDDANWRVIDTPRFSLNVRPGSFAEQNAARIGEVLEDQYDYTTRVLDFRYAGRVSVFLYDSAADADMEGTSGRAYPDTEAVRAVCVPPLDGNLFTLLSHESNHVIQQNGIGRPGTFFLGEGLPDAVLSERFHSWARHFSIPGPPPTTRGFRRSRSWSTTRRGMTTLRGRPTTPAPRSWRTCSRPGGRCR